MVGSLRVGQSRRAPVEPLLKSVPWDRNRTGPAKASKPGGDSRERLMETEVEEDILALPKDSDDEVESGCSEPLPTNRRAKNGNSAGPTSARSEPRPSSQLRSATLCDRMEGSDDSGDGTSSRADIKPTKFEKTTRAVSSQQDPPWVKTSETGSGNGAKRMRKYGRASLNASIRTAVKEKRGIGQVFQGSKRATERSPKRAPKKPKQEVTEDLREKPPRPRLQLPDGWHSNPEGDGMEQEGNRLEELSDDCTAGKAPGLRLMSMSPPKARTKARLNTRILDSPAKPYERRSARLRDLTMSPEAGTKHRAAALSPSPSPTRKTMDDLSSSELSDPPGDGLLRGATRCPYCNETVDRELLRNFRATKAGGDRLKFHQQRAFCAEHKRRDARALWAARGYPSPIDWAALPSRLAAHEACLERVLRGQARSRFADLLAADVRAGTKRNLLKADFNTATGYYGPRGFRIMQEAVFARFSPLLRERAVVDPLVSSRSYSLYVQAVLVPELATRLVMDDMGIGEERALEVLEESASVGELLCEDVDDVIESEEDEGF